MDLENCGYSHLCDEFNFHLQSYENKLQQMMIKYNELSQEKHQIREEMEKELTNLQKRNKKIASLAQHLW